VLLLFLVLSLGVFSVSASAEQTNIGQLSIYENHSLPGINTIGSGYEYITGDGEKSYTQGALTVSKSSVNSNSYFQQYLIVRPIDGNIMAESKIKTTITLENVYTSYLLNIGSHVYARDPNFVQFLVFYIDGSSEYVSGSVLGTSGQAEKTYKVTFTPDKDVKYFEVRIRTPFYSLLGDTSSFTVSAYYGETIADGRIKLTIDQPSEEAGLLEGIWGSLASGFDNLSQKLQSVVDTITNLPSKIWEFIENGLKSLFVPDEEYIEDYKSRWDTFLADKLGAVYQVVQITYGAWEDISLADTKNEIDFPKVTIPLPDNEKFSFGGMKVQIVPEKFEGIVDTLKIIVGIACTIMFVNGLRKRYDEVMGVEK